jgi:hypothetical protein
MRRASRLLVMWRESCKRERESCSGERALLQEERERVAALEGELPNEERFFGPWRESCDNKSLWLPVTPTKIFWAHKTMIPYSSFQIFVVSRAGLIIGADHLK